MSPKRFGIFSITALRIALGIVFLWFGLLKFTPYNPVYDLIHSSFPLLAEGWGLILLAAFETTIGLGLLFNIYPKLIHPILIAHMAGTFGTFITAPEIMFHPHFPILTLSGEFVIKNLVLAMGGLAVLWHQKRHGSPHS